MSSSKHSKEDIILALQNLAKKLGKTSLTKREVQEHIGVSLSTINVRFGSLGNALEAAGLERGKFMSESRSAAQTLSEDQLFDSIYKVEAALGHPPGRLQYEVQGQFSTRPFTVRFGKWPDVLAFYDKWKQETGRTGTPTQTSLPSQDTIAPRVDVTVRDRQPTTVLPTMAAFKPSQFYGEPIHFRGLRHAPINEQGVVYLFGMVSRELGFSVEAVQQGFPDCEAKVLYDAKKNLWAKARVEFEFKSSNFREQGHKTNGADFIVCWEHDWPDCPIQVVELRKEILKLPSR